MTFITVRNSLTTLLLIAALSLSAWSILIMTHDGKVRTQQNSNLPDAFMENVVGTIMNKQGTPSLKMFTPHMVHYVNNDATEIQQPAVIVYRDSPEPWHISSDTATATQGVEQILFKDHVVIHHTADTANPVTTMQTTLLTVFPNKQTAQTDQAVVIQQPDTTVHAIGMLANLNDGTVKLLSQAQGEYVPHS